MHRSQASEPLDLAGQDGLARRLTIADVVAVARDHRAIHALHDEPTRPLEKAMAASAEWIAQKVASLGEKDARPLYGINTGFGALAGRSTLRSVYQTEVLQRNLLVSHSAAAGPPLDEELVRAAGLVRAVQLCQGASGIRVEVVNRLIALLNGRVYPQIPSIGSLGASGDLAPLAYLALAISAPPEPGPGDEPLPVDPWPGEAWIRIEDEQVAETPPSELRQNQDHFGARHHWRHVDGRTAMDEHGGRIVLAAKEGLALTNGATVSAAIGALAASDAERVFAHAELAAAMSLEAARGFRDPLLPEVHAARGMTGQALVAKRMMQYVKGSTLLDPADRDVDPERSPPQDPYSLRCAPQVLGAGRDALAWITGILDAEINAAVDNPLVFMDLPRGDKVVSGGNFHGAPVAYAMDLLKIIMADCASISERRTFLLTNYRFDDPMRSPHSLPRFLVPHGAETEGLSSGLMIPQYTAAALTSDAKGNAHPDSIDSIPSSANLEDHVSMSMNAALRARRNVEHAEWVVAIELLSAAQGMSLRGASGVPGRGTGAALKRIRRDVAPLDFDRALHLDLVTMHALVRSGDLIAVAHDAISVG